jgi:hypothetical protein
VKDGACQVLGRVNDAFLPQDLLRAWDREIVNERAFVMGKPRAMARH